MSYHDRWICLTYWKLFSRCQPQILTLTVFNTNSPLFYSMEMKENIEAYVPFKVLKANTNLSSLCHAEVQLPSVPFLSLPQKNISSLSRSSNDQLQSFRPNSNNLKQYKVHQRVSLLSVTKLLGQYMPHSLGGGKELWVARSWPSVAGYEACGVSGQSVTQQCSGQTGTLSSATYSLPAWETLEWWGSEVKRSEVSGGWYGALGQRWGENQLGCGWAIRVQTMTTECLTQSQLHAENKDNNS